MDPQLKIAQEHKALLKKRQVDEEIRNKKGRQLKPLRNLVRKCFAYLRKAKLIVLTRRYVESITSNFSFFNYTVVRLMLVLFAPSFYITVLIMPELLENLWVWIGSVFPLIFLCFESIRWVLWSYQFRNVPHLWEQWDRLGNSLLNWSKAEIQMTGFHEMKTLESLSELIIDKANRQFYVSNDVDLRRHWSIDRPGYLIGSVNRILYKQLLADIARYKQLFKKSKEDFDLRLSIVSRPIYQSSLANDGSPDS